MMVPVGSYLWKRQSIHIIDFHHRRLTEDEKFCIEEIDFMSDL